MKRGLVGGASCPATNPSPEEFLPYDAQMTNSVQITPTGSLFVYYDNNGVVVAPIGSGCPPTVIRRVEIAFVAQTGNGVFDQGQAKEQVMSSVAIRTP